MPRRRCGGARVQLCHSKRPRELGLRWPLQRKVSWLLQLVVGVGEPDADGAHAKHMPLGPQSSRPKGALSASKAASVAPPPHPRRCFAGHRRSRRLRPLGASTRGRPKPHRRGARRVRPGPLPGALARAPVRPAPGARRALADCARGRALRKEQPEVERADTRRRTTSATRTTSTTRTAARSGRP